MKMNKNMFAAFGLLAAIAIAGPQPPEPPPFEKHALAHFHD